MLRSNEQAIQQQTTLNTVPQLKEIQWISLNKHIFLQPKKGKPWPTTSPQLKNTQARLIKKEKRERFWFIPTTSNQAYFEGQYKITKLAAYPISKVPILDERERNWINLHERGQYRQSVEKRRIRQRQLNKKKSSHWEQSTSSSRSRVPRRVPWPWGYVVSGKRVKKETHPKNRRVDSGSGHCGGWLVWIIITCLFPMCLIHSRTFQTNLVFGLSIFIENKK